MRGRYDPAVLAPASPDFRTVLRLLEQDQGPLGPKSPAPILDGLIATVLSQHTSDHNSARAFATLRERFGTWEAVAAATDDEVADAIRTGGMADQKAPRIRRILAMVKDREGAVDLSRLQTLDDAMVREYLTSLPGVGPKTAACVLLFSMDRAAFPVDTHVHRVAGRLGWIPARATAVGAQDYLECAVPEAIRYPLHLALVAHGRQVCRSRAPRCEGCVLRRECPRRGVTATGRLN